MKVSVHVENFREGWESWGWNRCARRCRAKWRISEETRKRFGLKVQYSTVPYRSIELLLVTVDLRWCDKESGSSLHASASKTQYRFVYFESQNTKCRNWRMYGMGIKWSWRTRAVTLQYLYSTKFVMILFRYPSLWQQCTTFSELIETGRRWMIVSC